MRERRVRPDQPGVDLVDRRPDALVVKLVLRVRGDAVRAGVLDLAVGDGFLDHLCKSEQLRLIDPPEVGRDAAVPRQSPGRVEAAQRRVLGARRPHGARGVRHHLLDRFQYEF